MADLWDEFDRKPAPKAKPADDALWADFDAPAALGNVVDLPPVAANRPIFSDVRSGSRSTEGPRYTGEEPVISAPAPGYLEGLGAALSNLTSDAPLGSKLLGLQSAVTPDILEAARGRGENLLGDFIRGVVNVAEPTGDALSRAIPEALGGLSDTEAQQTQLQPLYDVANTLREVGREDELKYVPTDIESVKANPWRAPQFVGEQAVLSIPDLVATLTPGGLVPYIGARTEQIGEARVAYDGREGEPTLGDLALSAPGAVVEATLERAANRALPGLGTGISGDNPLARIGTQAAVQGGTEAAEEVASYLSEALGTKTGVRERELVNRALAGGLGGAGTGGAIQSLGELVNAIPARPMEPLGDAIPEPAPPAPRTAEESAQVPAGPSAPAPSGPVLRAAEPAPLPGGYAADANGRVTDVDITAKPAPEAAAPRTEERRGDAREQQRIAELRALRRSGELTPEQSVELLDLSERDRLSAKVAGRRMQGVQTMEARNEAEARGELKPTQAFADADNFKAVNDRLGHDVGDSVIRNMGELFARELGDGNVYHRGGDEFVLQADSPEQLDQAMARVRDTLGRATLRATLEDGTTVEQRGVGFSYGHGPTIQEAESAQYADKEARKQAGLRADRGAAAGEQAPAEPVPIRGEAGETGPEAGEGRTAAAEVTPAVGTKAASVAARRALEGREPIVKEAARTNPETLDKAFKALGEDPNKGAEVVARLSRAGTEGISLDDEAVLLVHMSDLRQQRDAAAERIADPSLSEDAKAAATQEWGELEGRLNQAEQAANVGGREWGRFGQFRQRMLRDDFTLAALERKERARTGQAISPKDQAIIKVYAEKIAAAQKRADAAQARMAEVESTAAYDSLLKSMQEALRGPRQRPTLERLRTAANESRAALAAMGSVPSKQKQSGAVINPSELLFHYSRIGAYHVLNGATKFADWVDAMRADLGDKLDAVKDRLPQIFQASKLQAEKPVKPGASPEEVVAKIQGAPTPKDVRAVAEAHIRAGLRGGGPVLEATAKSLGMDVADVRPLFVQSVPRGTPRTVDEAKAHLRELRQQLREEMTGRQREQAQAQRDAMAPSEEERFQQNKAKALRKQIANLEARIAAGDFAKAAPKPPRALSAANEKAQFELTQAKEEFLRHQFEADLAKRSPLRKVFGGVGQSFNLARAFMTSLDLSGVLRQGGFITYGHPVRAARALLPSLKAFASEQAEHTAKSEILQRPNAPLYKKYGLELTGIGGGPLSQIEEAYASRWLERIPGWAGGGLVRGSGRAYATFLNKLRADSFDAMAAALAKGDKPTPEEASAIANYINVATGRGKVGSSANAGEVLNTVFFAPRLVASRFQLLAGQPLYGGSLRTRKLIAQEYARFLMGVSVAIGLAAFMKDPDDETPLLELDPRSSDFSKLRFGDTYLDPLAGLAQVTTLLSRLGTGETKTAKGVKPLRTDYTLTDLRRALGEDVPEHKLAKDGSLPFGSGNAADVITRFLRTKLAPVPGAIVNTLSGSNVIGEPVTPLQTAGELVTPMSFNNIAEIMEEQGVERGTAITLLGLLGMGVQYREPKAAKDAKVAKRDEAPATAGAP